jgi:8-oxo-dGTP pyrophosphatase MutT (NUDIX family)
MMAKLLRIAFLLKELWVRYVNPVQLGVRMALVQEGQVLLVRHTYMAGWHFPGGAMKPFETPLEAAAREAYEEAGAELLEPPTLVGVFTSFLAGKSDHVVVYLCRKFRLGQASDRWEIAECKFFGLDALPPDLAITWRKLLLELASKSQE